MAGERGSAIIHLVGYPGAGKLTVARTMAELAAERGHHLVVVDNHLTGNPVLAVLEPGHVPLGTWDLVYEIREVVNRAIGSLSPPHWSFVFTNVLWDHDEADHRAVARLHQLAEQRGSRYQVVVLECDADELLRRVPAPGRAEQLKLVDVDIVRGFLEARRLLRPDVPGRLDLDVTALAPADAAIRILDAAGLTA